MSDHDWALAVLCEESRPDAAVTVSEWADANRVLSSKASAEPGPWRTSRTPYLREIMDCLSSYSTVEMVAVMKGAQIGMSEAGLNFTGYCIHHAPGPLLYVMPTVDTAKKLSKTRLDPMIEASPALMDRIPPARSRDSSNTMFEKEFMGGVLLLTGANSASALRSMPIRYLVLDEVDGYPANVDEEGDPVNLAIKRTATFLRRKIFMLSTPTVKEFSRIGVAFRDGDQRYFNVPCDKCGTLQPITWKAIQWPKGDASQAAFVCQAVDSDGEPCAHRHEEHRKMALLDAGVWVATAEPKRPGMRSYHISSLYSPWASWGAVAQEFLDCFGADGRADPSKLQVFVNTNLGEEWEDKDGETVDAAGLMNKREDFGSKDADDQYVIPPAACVLTAGVDVQPDRVEVEIVAWGRDEESWSLEHRTIPGDPSAAKVWEDLDSLLTRRWAHVGAPDGLGISATCVDTGGANTMDAYAYVKPRQGRRVWGIKGASDYRALIWPKRPTKNNKGKIDLYLVGVHAAKDTIYKRLQRVGADAIGKGACHFPSDRDAGYFDQLTAETLKRKYVKGFPVPYFWKPDHARNEALDCRVYAYAALHGLVSLGLKLNATADAMSHRVEAAVAAGAVVHVPRQVVRTDLVEAAQTPMAPQPPAPPPAAPERPAPGGSPARRQGGWLNGGGSRRGGWLSR